MPSLGESIPVIREAGGEKLRYRRYESAFVGWIKVVGDQQPGESFLDKMIAGKGASRPENTE